jgi:hypothetical protein
MMSTKDLLDEYDSTDDEKKIRELSFALTKQNGIGLDDVAEWIETELQTLEKDATLPNTAETRTQLEKWKTLCERLAEVDQTHIKLRKYDTSEATPKEINSVDHESQTQLAIHAAQVVGMGSLTAFQLTDDEYAIIEHRDHADSGILTVRHKDRFYGDLNVVFGTAPSEYYEDHLKEDGWRRAKDLTDTEDASSDEASSNPVVA